MTVGDLINSLYKNLYQIKFSDEIELDKFGVLHVHTHTLYDEEEDYDIIIPQMKDK